MEFKATKKHRQTHYQKKFKYQKFSLYFSKKCEIAFVM